MRIFPKKKTRQALSLPGLVVFDVSKAVRDQIKPMFLSRP